MRNFYFQSYTKIILTRLAGNREHPLMEEWTMPSVPAMTLHQGEQYLFDWITDDLVRKVVGWNEETLKMNLIAYNCTDNANLMQIIAILRKI
ncbi:MAG: hypothetical protein RLZZ292_3284 [Bacteroidota bacterium]|jgi:hypothetical protein